ncbi:unnamed protein product, partial [Ectocarpus sp. 12 AP-2014]
PRAGRDSAARLVRTSTPWSRRTKSLERYAKADTTTTSSSLQVLRGLRSVGGCGLSARESKMRQGSVPNVFWTTPNNTKSFQIWSTRLTEMSTCSVHSICNVERGNVCRTFCTYILVAA